MTITGTQNRPYEAGTLRVKCIMCVPGKPARSWEFDWNSHAAVRYFAAQSDDCIRAGGNTVLEAIGNSRECRP